MFATALRALPRGIPASTTNVGITATQQAIMATGSVGVWAAVLMGAPWWAPRAGDRATRFFDRMAERMERMPKFRRPAGLRVTIPRVGSVGTDKHGTDRDISASASLALRYSQRMHFQKTPESQQRSIRQLRRT
ncbi:hypothetical protein K461DRAFT_290232 [Myriangium duriaei CBS 260.36]|uniref:Uncharacterized protein n=1 Tax=Myriangium duriaei CBS 260.36 TaxID=1168546 RepID=A0A9P4J9W5_9PEZI|nr:hypothetical protein K461DRAFT_290232 [Myriangium duriaei CBS 260.36]